MKYIKGQFLAFLTALLLMTSTAMADMRDMEIAELRGLDKVSGRIQTFEIPIDQTVRFGNNLYIRIRACRKSDPIEPPEAAAFMEVWEKTSIPMNPAGFSVAGFLPPAPLSLRSIILSMMSG